MAEIDMIHKRDEFEAELPKLVAKIKAAEAQGDRELAEVHRDTYEWMKGRINYYNKRLGL